MDEIMADDPPHSPQTVTFNVGGKLFETVRSLIDKNEDSMLARLVSDAWLGDPTKPVFIDRNGDIFAQVLDYLRYGSISLPVTVSKEMFLRDLDFYGIVPKEDTVKTYPEAWAREVAARAKKIDELKQGTARLELAKNIELLAHDCAGEYLRHGTQFFTFPKKKNEQQYKVACFATRSEGKEAFQKSLSKFGLCLHEANQSGREPSSSNKYVYHGIEYKIDIKLGLL